MTTTLIIFAVAAVAGLIILIKVLKGDETPKLAVVVHGLLAAIGLVLLTIYTVNNPDNAPMAGLIVLGIAALGGFVVLAKDLKTNRAPKTLAIIHAALALTGVVLLLLFAFG